MDLPTRPNEEVHRGADGYFASGLAQKLVIVRSYLLLAWAGDAAAVKGVVNCLDKVLPDEREDFPGHEEVLLDALDSLRDGVELVALLIYGEAIQPLCIRTRGFEIDGRRLYVLGSGGEAFLQFVLPMTEVIHQADTETGMLARATMMNFVGNAIMAQYQGAYGISQSWGGGFEIAYAADSGFAKVDNILVRCWSLAPDGELGNSGTSFLIHYEGDALHLTSFGDNEKTTVVNSWRKSDRAPSREIVVPEWTIDLFYRVSDGARLCAVQHDFPWAKERSIFRFAEGELVEWQMSKARMDKLVAKITQSDGTAEPFNISTL